MILYFFIISSVIIEKLYEDAFSLQTSLCYAYMRTLDKMLGSRDYETAFRVQDTHQLYVYLSK